MNNKRGISTVVATVLMIVITVAAVGIIWAAVIPMITNKLSSSTSCIDAGSQLQLVTDKGYPCMDGNDTINVQIKRGPKEIVFSGIQVLVSVGGNSYKYEYTDTDNMPGSNEERVLPITDDNLVSDTADVSIADATEISIAPMVEAAGGNEICDASSSVKIKTCVA
ncbi:MAG: archaellin/type IV pilin N-terminal domain-containing protein [archaeon]